MNTNCGIYQIVNIKNKHKYIGSSKALKKRKNRHFNELRKNKHVNPKLQNAFIKYTENNFRFYIIEYCEENQLLAFEQKYIDICFGEDCYNLSLKAGKPISTKGKKLSKEHRKKLSAAHKNVKLSKEHRRQIGAGSWGVNLQPKQRKKFQKH